MSSDQAWAGSDVTGLASCICQRGEEFTDGHAAFCPAGNPTERDGLTVGDEVLVNGQPGTVIGFNSLECDVTVRWPSGFLVTVCRRHAEVVRCG